MNPSRPHGPLDRELDHVSRAARCPSRACSAAPEVNPRSLGRTLSSTRRSTRWRRATRLALRLFAERGAFLFNGAAVNRALNFLAARVEPGSQSRRDSAESLESSGGLHVHSMRTTHGTITAVGTCQKDRRTKRV